MSSPRTKLRALEFQLLNPRPVAILRFVYALTFAFFMFLVWCSIFSSVEQRILRGAAYGLIAIYAGIIRRSMRDTIDYRPSQRDKESLIGWALAILAVLTLTGYSTLYPWTSWIWIFILLLGQFRMVDFVLRRNLSPEHLYVKTERGLSEVPDQQAREQIVEEVAGWFRHGLVSVKGRTLVKEGLDIPSNSVWAETLRQQYANQREEMARRDVLLAAIEIEAEGEDE